MKAPKKIWVREIPDRENLFCIGLSYHTKPQDIPGEIETEYVRADEVQKLVDALKEVSWKVHRYTDTHINSLIHETLDEFFDYKEDPLEAYNEERLVSKYDKGATK